jgi:hypothetical protein
MMVILPETIAVHELDSINPAQRRRASGTTGFPQG